MVEIVVIIMFMLIAITVIAQPILSPLFEGTRVKDRAEFQRESTKTASVTILEKNVGTHVGSGPKGITTESSKNIIMFELNGEEYYISVSSDFFNGLKQKGTMKLYLQDGEGKMLGETPDGKTEFLKRL